MNRLIIIGNGFDLAHGLPTSYRNFIDDYWKETISKVNFFASSFGYIDKMGLFTIQFELGIESFDVASYEFGLLQSYGDVNQFLKKFGKRLNEGDDHFSRCSITFNNKFFKILSDMSTVDWVDIENIYYKFLKDCLDQDFALRDYSHGQIALLNEEFEQIKTMLEAYLLEKVEDDFVFSKNAVSEFYKIFKTNTYSGLDKDKFYRELSNRDTYYFENGKELNGRTEDKIVLENYFLSFNYTSTVSKYIKELNLDSNNLNEIHGRLGDEKNLINFGFGDEMDRQYQEIEDTNDNEYLRNIKSFQYLHTTNYKNLLNLIDSDKFQVYIMGHSCGLSDRTLLNTIFEHENCCSIKVYYHEREDGTDNYTEITQNISRHFNKKKLMREKIVNKTLCQPLPQIQLPRK